MSTVKVQVLRAFSVGGERQEVGSTLDVPAALAAELIANHKATVAPEVVEEVKEKPVRARKEKTE